MSFTYAAYNAAPPALAADAAEEGRWYGLLREERLIGGLELGFDGVALHPGGVARLAELVAPRWRNVASTMTGTINGVARDDSYGLASTSGDGRRAALDGVRAFYEQLRQLQDAHGEDSVIAVELQSAPGTSGGESSAERFADSLEEIASWDWGSVVICAEHSDAAVDGRTPAKGFLSLGDEIRAVESAAARTGVPIMQSINWGRSAIETRSVVSVTGHIADIAGRGNLGGLMFSGAGPAERSPEWQDVHLATAALEPGSLLTAAAIDDALAAAGEGRLSFAGVKVGAAIGAETLEERLALGLGTLRELERAAGDRRVS